MLNFTDSSEFQYCVALKALADTASDIQVTKILREYGTEVQVCTRG